MLNWFTFLGVDLKKWPTLAAYHQKHLKRAAVAQAMGVEDGGTQAPPCGLISCRLQIAGRRISSSGTAIQERSP
jgi:hypothetical protein